MKRLWYGVMVIVLGFFISCTATQMQAVKKSFSENIPDLLTTITTAYGGPYSALIGSFINNIAGDTGSQKEAERELIQNGGYYQDSYVQENQAARTGGDTGTYQPQGDESYVQRNQTAQAGRNAETYQQWDEPSQGYYQDQASYTPEYQSAQTQGRASTVPYKLQVEIDVVMEDVVNGRYQVRPVTDGETLTRDNNYKVRFQCNMQCYIYVAQLDATGKIDPIFPSEFVPGGNPLRPNILYSAPPDNDWFYLDENTGRETIYFVVSRTRRTDIEQKFRQITEMNRTLVQSTPVSLEESWIITRGIGGSRKGRQQSVSFQDGSQGQYASTIFSSSGADLVLTRWFYHR